MATRLVGVDSEDPKLPDAVLAASAGHLELTNAVMTAPNGAQYRLTVSNFGVLTTTPISGGGTPPPDPDPVLPKYLALNGTDQALARVTAGGDVYQAGSQSLVALIRMPDFTPATNNILASLWRDIGGQRSTFWSIFGNVEGNSGSAYIQVSTNGTAIAGSQLSGPPSAVPASDAFVWVKFDYDATNRRVTYSTAPAALPLTPETLPSSGAWTQRAQSATGTAIGTPFNPTTAEFVIGGLHEGGYEQFRGDIAQLAILNGSGTVQFRADPYLWTSGSTWTSTTSHTLTLTGAAIITDGTTAPPPPDPEPEPEPDEPKFLALDGTAASVARVTAGPDVYQAGTHSLIALIRMADFTPATNNILASLWRDTGTTQRSIYWSIFGNTGGNSGAAYFQTSANGTTVSGFQVSGPPSSPTANDTFVWVKFDYNATNRQVTYSTAPASDPIVPDVIPTSWTQRAQSGTGTALAAPVDPTVADFVIGGLHEASGFEQFIGDIAQLAIVNAGGTVFRADPYLWTGGTTWVTSTNHTVALTGSAVITDDDATPPPVDPPPPTGGGPLPFTMPATTTLRNASRKVYAHYFPQFPVSFDNLNPPDYYTTGYNAVGGEGGKHAAYGGYFRNRPIPRAPRSGDWQLEDMKDEVRWAIAAGYDGFTVNIMSLGGYLWERTVRLLQAAASVDSGFKIVLMPDLNTGVDANITAMADAMSTLAGYPAAARTPDGRLIIWPFMSEGQTASWWQQWLGLMSARGHNVALITCFISWNQALANSFAPFSYGFSIWGGRSPNSVTNLSDAAAAAHALGKVWYGPVAFQDNRPYSGIYDEALNTQTWRDMWAENIAGNAEGIQVITWGDFSEATEITPTANMGWVPLDLSAYYITRFKVGAPAINKDVVYISHRRQPYNVAPTGGQTLRMALRSGSSAARNGVEILTFLRLPATVSVNVGGTVTSYSAPAGVNAHVVNLGNGTISATATASDGVVTSVTSPYPVTSTPVVEDFQYRMVSSGRSGTQTG